MTNTCIDTKQEQTGSVTIGGSAHPGGTASTPRTTKVHTVVQEGPDAKKAPGSPTSFR